MRKEKVHQHAKLGRKWWERAVGVVEATGKREKRRVGGADTPQPPILSHLHYFFSPISLSSLSLQLTWNPCNIDPLCRPRSLPLSLNLRFGIPSLNSFTHIQLQPIKGKNENHEFLCSWSSSYRYILGRYYSFDGKTAQYTLKIWVGKHLIL